MRIKKDPRAAGKYHHKMPRCGASPVKGEALKDMTAAGINSVYLSKESVVLELCKDEICPLGDSFIRID
jgi:hypothetical protein